MPRPQPSSGIQVAKELNEKLFIEESVKVHPADCTCRPDQQATKEKGTKFTPFELPSDRDPDPVPRDLPGTPLLLFQYFIPIFLIQKWVLYTDQHVKSLLEDPKLPKHARLRQWKETSVEEIYLWLGILIHIGIHKEPRIRNHWEIPKLGKQGTIHTILQFMTFDRFHLILRNIRIFPPNNNATSYHRTFGRCDEWSDHIQRATTDLVILGINCAIDECMIRYKGRSLETTIVKGKPTPRGLKAWAVAQKGLLLRWIWHLPKHPWGLLTARKEEKKNGNLNPTQAVVIMLIKALPRAIYHVFFDNLFSTARLLARLRDEEFGATATARINSGFFKPFVAAKKQDKKNGKSSYKYNQIKTAPTPDNKVKVLKNTLLHDLQC